MKKFSKILSVALLVALVLSLGVANAFAQTVGTAAEGKGSITISNASKGERYKVTKIFDASVTGTEGGAISYSGTIPSGLEDFFEYTDEAHTNVVLKDGADEEALFAKLQELYGTLAEDEGVEADGTTLVFEGLDYGYYVVSTSQGEAAITVDSTNPNAQVVDKNITTPDAAKDVDDKDVYIGETVTYTLEFNTTNWLGQGANSKQVVRYDIEDTTPEYLSNVTVTGISIGGTAITPIQQFNNKVISLTWAEEQGDGSYKSLYGNGDKIVITYTAVVNDKALAGDADGNRNVVTLKPYVDDNGPKPWNETFKDDETIKTYGAAIHKVDDKGNDLKGAKFAIPGLTVTEVEKGKYTVSNYVATSTELGTEMEVDDNGYIFILGLPSDITLQVTETEAPEGYNKLTAPVTLTPIKMAESHSYTERTVYYDADGKVIYESVTGGSTKTVTAGVDDLKTNANVLAIENKTGTELPSTGGIGTTIFYVVGGVLVLAAIILLVTKKRMSE